VRHPRWLVACRHGRKRGSIELDHGGGVGKASELIFRIEEIPARAALLASGLGAVELAVVVAAAKREREVAQVPRRGTCKCVRAGSAVRRAVRGRCATVRAGGGGMSVSLRGGEWLLLVLGWW